MVGVFSRQKPCGKGREDGCRRGCTNDQSTSGCHYEESSLGDCISALDW